MHALETPDILLAGDVILCRGSGALDFIIRFGQALARRQWTPSCFSHAAICTSPMTVIDADIFKPLGTRALDNWLRDVRIDEAKVFRRPSVPRPDSGFVQMSMPEEAANELAPDGTQNHSEIAIAAQYFVDRVYNWLFLRPKANREKSRSSFCSEFVMRACARVDPQNFTEPPEEVLPIDLPSIFSRAGWSERTLSDMFLASRVKARAMPKPADIERARDALSDSPELFEAWYSVISKDSDGEFTDFVDQFGKKSVEAEAFQIESAKLLTRGVQSMLEFWGYIAREIGAARDDAERRSLFSNFGLPVWPDQMPQVLDWLLLIMDDQSNSEPPAFELLEGYSANVERLRDIQMVVHSFRSLLLSADSQVIIDRYRLIANGLTESVEEESADARVYQFRRWFKELYQLIEAYPYLQAIDEAAESPFREKLQQCAEKLRLKAETTGTSPQWERERALHGYLAHILPMYPLGKAIKTLTSLSETST